MRSAGDLERPLGRDEGVLAPLVESHRLAGEHVVLEESVAALAQERQDRVCSGEALVESPVVDEEDGAARRVDLRRLDQAARGREDLCLFERGNRSRRPLQEPTCARKVVLDDGCVPTLASGNQELESALGVLETTQVADVAAGEAAYP